MSDDSDAQVASGEVTAAEEGERLDVYISTLPGVGSRSQARRLIDDGRVRVNGRLPAKAGVKLYSGDSISVEIPPPRPARLTAQALPLDIVYEDEQILVINKAKGMVVHPAPGHPDGTLVNALLYHCPSLPGVGGVRRPGIVHRLDKDTSGLLVVAKTDSAHRCLVSQLKARTVKRIYQAIVHGGFREDEGSVEAPIGRHPILRQKMAVTERGRPAVSHFRVLKRYDGFTLIEVRLETGRTHQIRVHMASIGHPVAGDPVYGPKEPVLLDDGQALHAYRLSFKHPGDGRNILFEAPLPQGMRRALATLDLGPP